MIRSFRVAHIADTHLGYRSATIPRRSEDFAESWREACRQIVDAKPDLILHAGDVFHRPNPSWASVIDFLEGATILKEANVPIFGISGNHDSSRFALKHTVFSVLSEAVPHIVFSYADLPQVHPIAELDAVVVLLSHQALLNPNLEENLKNTIFSLSVSGTNILVAHGDIGDLDKSREAGSIVIPDFVFNFAWDYIALGHLHLAQPFGRTGWYSGSIERCGWSDYPAEPGWTLVTLSPNGRIQHQQRSLPHMSMIQLPILQCGGDEEINIVAEVLEGLRRFKVPKERAVARVQLNGVHLFARRALQATIQRIVKEHYPNLLFQVVVESGSSVWSDPTDAPQETSIHSIEDMFKDFVEVRSASDATVPPELLDVGLSAIAKARSMEDEEHV